MSSPRFRIREIALAERDTTFRMPFRFGIVTLRSAPLAHLRVRIEDERGRSATGMTAELLAPKWFDKNPELSNEDNFRQLEDAIRIAARLYQAVEGPETAFGHFAAVYPEQIARGAAAGLNPLVAGFGPAQVDRAVLDAVCRLEGVSIYKAMQANLPGIVPTRLLPEFAGFDFDAFLRDVRPAATIQARHTVGMVDPITAADQNPESRLDDGLPETLEEVVAAYGHRYFKLKVGGDITADIARLEAIAGVLDRLPHDYKASLDGNEQYGDAEGILALWREMQARPALERLCRSILFIEQPIARARALEGDVALLDRERPVIIDESDGTLDAFAQARRIGYSGISAKSCKGFYKAMMNAARCRMWNAEEGRDRFFMSAEDLTIQAGISLQQDLALATLIGVGHIERNGHHYVNGMAIAPAAEQDRFLAAHGDLYERSHGAVRLRIRDGAIAIGSLDCTGFATGVAPDFSAMRPVSLDQ
ncbi:enolase C-terminal domain-like protein [Oceanibacterium hippocampi]|uniref:Enolase C-terminal domain-containing protein n=1 Tax=Oceanibacterium hippocampi TaxID=745714 RepID=A0A1Y5RXB2_9PROT|nr:enolase C-terminal domain-like protein [Oceanibacterium hippocampi]SLN27782.1 hypothetical protein OCH7691_00913 [Oceanibacterium hippocampi]